VKFQSGYKSHLLFVITEVNILAGYKDCSRIMCSNRSTFTKIKKKVILLEVEKGCHIFLFSQRATKFKKAF